MMKEVLLIKKSLKHEIVILNVALCLIVIFIHISSQAITSLDRQSWQYISIFIPWKLSSFVVQGFILLSGIKIFLNYNNDESNWKRFYWLRFKGIVLPYILWVVVYYIYFCNKNYFPFHIADLLGYIASGELVGHFYFIVAIMQFYLLMPVWKRLVNKVHPVFAIPASFIIMVIGQWLPDILALINPDIRFAYTDRVFTTYLAYWIAGCYIGLYYPRFKELLKTNGAFIMTVCMISAAFNIILSYFSITQAKYIPYLETLHMLYSVCMILSFYLASLKLADKLNKNRLIANIDRASYKIYLSHCLTIFYADDILNSFEIKDILYAFIFKFVFVYLVTLAVCIGYESVKAGMKSYLKNRKDKKTVYISCENNNVDIKEPDSSLVGSKANPED